MMPRAVSPLAGTLCGCFLFAASSGLKAQEPEPAAKLELVPPVATVPTELEISDDAWGPVTVEVIIRVDELGEVTQVRRSKETPASRFSEALMTAATHFLFEPATYDGEPVPVEITFRKTFIPPSRPAAEDAGSCQAELSGQVIEKGTGKAIHRASVVVENQGELFQTKTDEEGRFELSVPAGSCKIEIFSQEHRRFRVHELLSPRESLEVRYLVERNEYGTYEAMVVGKRERGVVARTTLRAREIKQVPGSFGDPFRVVTTLPGVATLMSLLSYPIVRGSSPGNTGYLLDGVELPQLFHLFAGPAVLHPEFIDHIDFYPGTFPVHFGGYTGGIINGLSRRPRPEEASIETNVDLTRAGLFIRMPFESAGISTTGAVQYGYPGLLLSALSPETSLAYWDYQLRVDGSRGGDRFKAFIFGSHDKIGSVDENGRDQTNLAIQFHKLDLSYSGVTEGGQWTANLASGFDQTQVGEGLKVSSWHTRPRFSLKHQLGGSVQLRGGIEATVRRSKLGDEMLDTDIPLNIDRENLAFRFSSAGAYAALTWEPVSGLLLIPGVRADVYQVQPNDDLTAVMGDDEAFKSATQISADPRLLARYRLAALEDGELWLKGGTGLFHQPPRFPIPLPGLVGMGLHEGLLQSWQSSFGIEAPLLGAATIDAQVYYQYTDPIFLDFETNADPLAPPDDNDDGLELSRTKGRAYGFEIIIKHKGEGRLFGWLSYTLARADRRLATAAGRRWLPYDFDVTHSANLVAGISLPRNWQVGIRGQAHTGRPVYTIQEGRNSGRLPGFFRLDLRIDKRAVYDEWLLDFYIDIINATLTRESVDNVGSGFRYVLPTVGFRAVL